MNSCRTLTLLVCLLLQISTIFVGPSAIAADAPWPSKPITLVVPFPPGGGVDLLARTLQPALAEAFGQTVIVENRPGAAGAIGAALVAKAAPDGYTLLVGNSATNAINASLYKNLPYNPLKDFEPIIQLVRLNFVLVVPTGSKFSTTQDLIAFAKQNPGKLTYGSAGSGTATHLAMELLKSAAGVDIVHVPFAGVGPATTALLGGHVDMLFGDEPALAPQIKAQKVKALAVGSAMRSPILPEVATIAESGVAGYEVYSWQGLLAPAGTPKATVDRIHAVAAKAVDSPSVREKLLASGNIPVASNPEQFTKFIASEISKWAAVVKATGAQVD